MILYVKICIFIEIKMRVGLYINIYYLCVCVCVSVCVCVCVCVFMFSLSMLLKKKCVVCCVKCEIRLRPSCEKSWEYIDGGKKVKTLRA